ncbi:hypothetical protein FB451DRAFT_1393489 [Mycena latifolia]|nr:hypothetical protein FB451DRAFT_1393489 [Mycena latifolia]
MTHYGPREAIFAPSLHQLPSDLNSTHNGSMLQRDPEFDPPLSHPLARSTFFVYSEFLSVLQIDETNRPIWKCQESGYGNFPNRGSSLAASLTTTVTVSAPDGGTTRGRRPPTQHDLSAPAPSSSKPVRAGTLILTCRHSWPPPSFLRDIPTARARIQGTTINPPRKPGHDRYSPQIRHLVRSPRAFHPLSDLALHI